VTIERSDAARRFEARLAVSVRVSLAAAEPPWARGACFYDDRGNELFEAITRIAQLRPVCPGPEVDPGAWCKRDSLSPTANEPSLVCAQVARSRPAGAPQAS
jgi:hypothetical protein